MHVSFVAILSHCRSDQDTLHSQYHTHEDSVLICSTPVLKLSSSRCYSHGQLLWWMGLEMGLWWMGLLPMGAQLLE